MLCSSCGITGILTIGLGIGVLCGDELTEYDLNFIHHFFNKGTQNQPSIVVSVVSMLLWDQGRGRSPVVATYMPASWNRGLHTCVSVLSARGSELIQLEGEGAT